MGCFYMGTGFSANAYALFLPLVAISLYVAFMGFCFCDGFKLHVGRKLIWFLVFLLISLHVFATKGNFDLSLILPVPVLLAFLFCSMEQRAVKVRKR